MGFALLILTIILIYVVEWVLPYKILQMSRRHSTNNPTSIGLRFDSLSVTTNDGYKLDGWWVYPNTEKAVGTILLVHGARSLKEYFLYNGVLEGLVGLGLNVVAFDNRAHGKSEGQYCTFGYYEQTDVTKIIDLIKAKTPQLPLGIWGHSLGGTISILTLAKDKRVEFGVIESTFSNLRETVSDYKRRLIGFSIPIVANRVLNNAGQVAQFEPDAIQPLERMKEIQQPVFIAHGTLDDKIKVQYAHELFGALQSEQKYLHIIPNAKHSGLWRAGGQAYQEKVLGFIQSQL